MIGNIKLSDLVISARWLQHGVWWRRRWKQNQNYTGKNNFSSNETVTDVSNKKATGFWFSSCSNNIETVCPLKFDSQTLHTRTWAYRERETPIGNKINVGNWVE